MANLLFRSTYLIKYYCKKKKVWCIFCFITLLCPSWISCRRQMDLHPRNWSFDPLHFQTSLLFLPLHHSTKRCVLTRTRLLKFIYSETATKFCEIFPLLLTVCTVVKNKGKISQYFVAFSEYMNFNTYIIWWYVYLCRIHFNIWSLFGLIGKNIMQSSS